MTNSIKQLIIHPDKAQWQGQIQEYDRFSGEGRILTDNGNKIISWPFSWDQLKIENDIFIFPGLGVTFSVDKRYNIAVNVIPWEIYGGCQYHGKIIEFSPNRGFGFIGCHDYDELKGINIFVQKKYIKKFMVDQDEWTKTEWEGCKLEFYITDNPCPKHRDKYIAIQCTITHVPYSGPQLKKCSDTLIRDVMDDEKESELIKIGLDSNIYPTTLWELNVESFKYHPGCSLKELQARMQPPSSRN